MNVRFFNYHVIMGSYGKATCTLEALFAADLNVI